MDSQNESEHVLIVLRFFGLTSVEDVCVYTLVCYMFYTFLEPE